MTPRHVSIPPQICNGVMDNRPPRAVPDGIQKASGEPHIVKGFGWRSLERRLVRRTRAHRKNLPFVAWVSVGTGTVFLVLSLPVVAFSAFAVGACCAYAARRPPR